MVLRLVSLTVSFSPRALGIVQEDRRLGFATDVGTPEGAHGGKKQILHGAVECSMRSSLLHMYVVPFFVAAVLRDLTSLQNRFGAGSSKRSRRKPRKMSSRIRRRRPPFPRGTSSTWLIRFVQTRSTSVARFLLVICTLVLFSAT